MLQPIISVNSQQQLTQHLGSTKHKLVSLGLLPKPSEDPNVKKVVSARVQGYFNGFISLVDVSDSKVVEILSTFLRVSTNARHVMLF